MHERQFFKYTINPCSFISISKPLKKTREELFTFNFMQFARPILKEFNSFSCLNSF